jgi:hypothetical protein
MITVNQKKLGKKLFVSGFILLPFLGCEGLLAETKNLLGENAVNVVTSFASPSEDKNELKSPFLSQMENVNLGFSDNSNYIAQTENNPNNDNNNQNSPDNGQTKIKKNKAADLGVFAINVEQSYYNWNDDLGNNGSQYVAPVTFTYNQGNFDLGLRTAYINSSLDGVITFDGQKVGTRKGDVSTTSDTSVTLAYTLKNLSAPIRFNLDFNLPTGQATLVGSERNALMDGSLVQQTRFGEGLNIAPGIGITYPLSKRDVIGAGFSYIFKGKFDPNGDVVNDEITPGDEAVATLQYQHTGQNMLFIGGLIYTNSGVTKRGDLDYYQKGDRLDTNATLVFAPFPGNTIKLFGRYYTQNKDNVRNFFTGNLQEEAANSNGNALYLGFDWGLALDKKQKHTIHFLVDTLNVKANNYDRINDLFNGNRNKWSFGLGYDYSLSSNSRFSIQAKYFNMIDEANPRTLREISYNGYNIFGTVNFSF